MVFEVSDVALVYQNAVTHIPVCTDCWWSVVLGLRGHLTFLHTSLESGVYSKFDTVLPTVDIIEILESYHV